jgi:hypothetical protein
LHVSGVLAIDAGGFHGIEFLQATVELIEGKGLEFGAQLRIGSGKIIRPVGEELEVEPGTSNHERSLAAGFDLGEHGEGEIAKAGGIKRVGGINDAVEVVGNDGPFFLARGSGKRRQASIELEGIGIDDLAITGARQSESGGGFAGSSGAAEEESVQWAVFRRNERFLVPNPEY